MLRKQIFAGLVSMMNQIVVTEPDLIIGCGQGAIIALLAGLPLVLEKACRMRATTQDTTKDYRRAWARIRAIVAFDPSLQLSGLGADSVHVAVPEISKPQPTKMPKFLVVSPKFHQKDFAAELGLLLRASTDRGKLPAEPLRAALLRRSPIFFESDLGAPSEGKCVVCLKGELWGDASSVAS